MPMTFSNPVAVPSTSDYAPKPVDASAIANLPNVYRQAGFDQQQKQLNDARIQQTQRIADLQKQLQDEFSKTGQIDYRKAAGIIAAMGNPAEAMQMLQQQQAPISPFFGGQGGGGAQPQGGGQSAPASIEAKPLPPIAKNAPQGDQPGSVIGRVSDILPPGSDKVGVVAGNIAKALKVDPNASLSPEQAKKADGLIQSYAQRNGLQQQSRLNDAFGQVSGQGGGKGNLPPSANAGTPSASAGAGSLQRTGGGLQGGQAAPQQQPAPQASQAAPQQPLVPQPPLPDGYTDPMKAATDLRREAVRLAASPQRGAAEQSKALQNWAERIEQAQQPIQASSMTTLLDPHTGKPVYQGPGAAALQAAQNGQGSSTIDADAEAYRQTGKLPPNMGRGQQGAAEAKAIRARAAELEIEQGGDPSQWSTRWQNFATDAVGQRVLKQRAVNLRLAENEASSLIPRVREISDKIDRTRFPTLNSLILAAEKGTGGEDVVKFGIAVSSLIPVYARVLKPVGQITEGDTHRARDILDQAWSKGQINAALDQMKLELESARTSLDKTIAEQKGEGKGESKGEKSQSTPTVKGASKPDAEGWVSLPNGVRIREIN